MPPMTPRLRTARALALAVALAGCDSDGLLDVVSPTTVSDEIFWARENDAVIFLNGTYSALPSWIQSPPPRTTASPTRPMPIRRS